MPCGPLTVFPALGLGFACMVGLEFVELGVANPNAVSKTSQLLCLKVLLID